MLRQLFSLLWLLVMLPIKLLLVPFKIASAIIESQGEYPRLPVSDECSDACRNRGANRRGMKPTKWEQPTVDQPAPSFPH